MASGDLRAELECSVCLNIYTDPVMLRCGHNFCRVCIDRVLDTQGGSGGYSCPECREKFPDRPALQKNISLRNIAETFLSAHPDREESGVFCTYCVDSPVPAVRSCLLCEVSLCDKHLRVHKKSPEHILCDPTLSMESRKCSIHKEVLKYFCTEDETCICISCCMIGEHKGHEMESLDEASEKKKETLRNVLQKLLTKRKETEERVQSLQEHRRKVEEEAPGDTERVTALFIDLRRHLEDLEKRILRDISGRAERISISIRDLEIKKEELSRKMRHIEELCNMTDPLTVLQESDTGDLCDTEDGDNEDRERHEELLHDGGGLDVAGVLHTGLSDIITEVNVYFYIQGAADILLDGNTAHKCLQISDDRKTVTRSDRNQNLPETPERFQYYQVLSSQSFSSGRHYWDVDVWGSENWRVGMCYPSIERRGGESRIGWNKKSWGLVRYNNQYKVRHDSKLILLPTNLSSNRVRIYLDYEAGQISFYDLCDPIRHLHTFTTTFTEPLHAGLRVYDGCIKICGRRREIEFGDLILGTPSWHSLSGLLTDILRQVKMTKKKGEEHPQQPHESSLAQATRAAKEKGNLAVSASAAASKLEKFAHTPSHSPTKGAQQSQEKTGSTGDRKSLSKTTTAVLTTTKMANKKSPERDPPGKSSEVNPGIEMPSETEPTLKEVLSAVNACRGSLSDLCDQLRGLKEELCSMSQELQKTVERTSNLEERLSQVEDILHPMRQEFRMMQTQLDSHKNKMDEMENRLRRQNMEILYCLLDYVEDKEDIPLIVVGDFNMVLNGKIDRFPPTIRENRATEGRLTQLLEEIGWCDLWRIRNPEERQYSCYSESHQTLSHIDMKPTAKSERATGRKCPSCKNPLKDFWPKPVCKSCIAGLVSSRGQPPSNPSTSKRFGLASEPSEIKSGTISKRGCHPSPIRIPLQSRRRLVSLLLSAMASADLRAELECSVCLNIYTDPVTLKCGHNFCRVCIDRVLDTQEGSGGYSCPECREEFPERPALHRNITLRNIAENFLSAHPDQEESGVFCTYCVDSPVPAVRSCLHCEVSLCDKHLRVHKKSPEHILCDPTLSMESRKCSVHKKILEYYCTEDETCVCKFCVAGEHRGHQMDMIDEASEKKKETLRKFLQKLLTKREETEERVQSLQEHRRKVEEEAAGNTKRVTALFRDLRRRLEDLEKRMLRDISGRAEQISISIRDLEIIKEELSRKIRHIEELCNMMDPLTVLQDSDTGDLCDTEDGDNEDRERHEELLHDGGGLDVAGVLHTGLSGIITEVYVYYIQGAADILLDGNTANNNLQISDDRKTVSWSDIDQNYPKTPKRFQDYSQVLSSQSFSSGRHYWEVDVGGSESWRVGMCYPSIDRDTLIGDNKKSWGLYWDDDQYEVIYDSKVIPTNISSNRVRIYLDYEAGRISFYDLCDPIQHLHTFTTTFTEPLYAGLGVWDGCIKICGGNWEM
ncbi:uncharacterized protein [Aquarana catesbeiana]|uniref:uncharacterized protein n=1 Tax=Aquarana catesbeiana TaxID=8400 RepID=UPI003CC92BBA